MRVVFCGFDGVLHPCSAVAVGFGDRPVRLFEWLDILEALLAPHDDAFVVVHSHWREDLSPVELCAILRPLGRRFLGCVPRGAAFDAIQRWLRCNPSVASYRILDDAPKRYPDPPPPELLVCHPETGIFDWRVRRQLASWLHGVVA